MPSTTRRRRVGRRLHRRCKTTDIIGYEFSSPTDRQFGDWRADRRAARLSFLRRRPAGSPRGDVDLVEFASVGVLAMVCACVWLAGWHLSWLRRRPVLGGRRFYHPRLALCSALLLPWTKNESQSRLIEDIEKQYRGTHGTMLNFL